jgi:hypothetical protein
MSPSRQRVDTFIYQLKVALKDSKPPIWRRIQVAGDTKQGRLHRILQAVMGWEDYHLHQFKVGGTAYGVPDREFPELAIRNERSVPLSQFAPREKARFIYEYDFGDSWEHEILVQKILPPAPGARLPVCIVGKRACPPEDCGGVWGYDSFVEAIQDPDHPEHEDMLAWVGRSFDPEAFDLDDINERLRHVR